MSERAAPQQQLQADPGRKDRARARRALVHQRIRLASDALAAADLLLGLNRSLAAIEGEERA